MNLVVLYHTHISLVTQVRYSPSTCCPASKLELFFQFCCGDFWWTCFIKKLACRIIPVHGILGAVYSSFAQVLHQFVMVLWYHIFINLKQRQFFDAQALIFLYYFLKICQRFRFQKLNLKLTDLSIDLLWRRWTYSLLPYPTFRLYIPSAPVSLTTGHAVIV